MKRLKEVVNEYTIQVADLLGCSYEDCYWVGTDIHGNGTFSICDFGDTTFLTLEQMQVIIDRLPEWEQRYGSREAVADEVREWLEWSLDKQNVTCGHPRINIEHWLMGCPREKPEPTIFDELAFYRDEMEATVELIDRYGDDSTLFDVKGEVNERIDTILREIEKHTTEQFDEIKKGQSLIKKSR